MLTKMLMKNKSVVFSMYTGAFLDCSNLSPAAIEENLGAAMVPRFFFALQRFSGFTRFAISGNSSRDREQNAKSRTQNANENANGFTPCSCLLTVLCLSAAFQ